LARRRQIQIERPDRRSGVNLAPTLSADGAPYPPQSRACARASTIVDQLGRAGADRAARREM